MKFVILFMTTLLALSSAVFAGSNDNLILRGVVSTDCNIKVVADHKAQNLDILAGESLPRIAIAVETCNKKDGYTISMRSIHGDKLVNTTNSSHFVNYKLSYDGSPFVAPGTSYHHVVKTVGYRPHKKTEQSYIGINLTAAPNALEGIYEDTVTFTIEAL